MKKSVLAMLMCAAFSAMAHADEPFSTKYQIVVPPAPQFTPTKVWDDGKFTYIQLRAPYTAISRPCSSNSTTGSTRSWTPGGTRKRLALCCRNLSIAWYCGSTRSTSRSTVPDRRDGQCPPSRFRRSFGTALPTSYQTWEATTRRSKERR